MKKSLDDDDEEVSKPKVLQLNWWRKLMSFIISFLVRSYPYLHKMDNLCVDFKRRTVKYEQDQKRFHILRTRSGKFSKYSLDQETLKKLSDIIAKRQQQEESVNEKVESLQADLKKLKINMKNQHEELKKLIQECLNAKET